MNGRLKLIEQQLTGIDSAAFQNLCDVYLFLREQEIASINRTGSQFGKQKTTKGTPDTFFRLADGSLRYVEYTTKADGIVAKINDDIDKCLDPTKTNIDPKEIHKIIICFNSKLAVDEEDAITKHAQSKNVRIELIGLDWLALEIYSKYLILAKDILGLPLDTGQLLPIHNFIEEYNNKAVKLTTPLDNIFLYRETELKDIEQSLLNDDIIILSGFPGVGKTKIAIEAIEKFITQNTSYHAFAVSKKDQDISDDLKIHLQKDNDYILLVDDANRQLLNFKQILGIFKEKRKGKIKLLITVRDYALYDVANECSEYSPKQISLKKFTDEEIIGIISSDSFEIRNSKYQRKIVEVCDGNARLAVMAARIAKEKQEHFLFGDVSDLYDSYFQSFVKDYDIFRKSSFLKTLAIISFFYTINRSDKKFIELVLQTFSVDYHEFNEAIAELNNRELVEIQFDHVRISEQVTATYFFYVTFIKNDILSFRNLLFTFFKDWQKRFSDTIIPANNSFGYNNVFEKINPSLNEYIHSIYSDENAIANFFSIFWFYKRDELLNYVHSKIAELETPLNPVYKIENDRTDIFGTRDNTINLLSNLFIDFTESYSVAIELALEYCTKKPSTFPILIKKINEIVSFDSDDSKDGFIRQRELFKILTNGLELQKPIFLVALCGLANKFLGYSFQKTTSVRRRAFSLYRYQLPITDTIKELRKNIWQALFKSNEIHPNEIFAVIKEFHPHEPIIELLDFDLSLLVPFLDAKFSPTSFKHILYVNELIRSLDRVQGIKRDYQNLGKKFTSSEYEVFRKLDWNLARTGYKYTNHLDFEKHVRSEIANYFTFNSQSDFTSLENGLKTILTNEEALKGSGLVDSLDIIVEANFSHNEEIAFSLLQRLFICWPNLPVLKSSIHAIVNKNEEFTLRLWKLILVSKNESKLYWQLFFFHFLPEQFANSYYRDALVNVAKSISQPCTLRFEGYEKFLPIHSSSIKAKFLRVISWLPFIKKAPNVFEELLEIVCKLNENSLRIGLSFDFFYKYAELLKSNFPLMAKAYYQQDALGEYYDLDKKDLKALIKIKPEFLLEYLSKTYTSERSFNSKIDNFQFVWDMDNSQTIVTQAVNEIISKSSYWGISEHPITIFFKTLDAEQAKKARAFLLDYVSRNNNDPKKMNAVFDVLRHEMRDFFEEAFLCYLSLNHSIETFREIMWRGNGGSYSGDVIIGEIQAAEWQELLSMIEKSPNQVEIIPIKTYVRKQIEYELRNGEEERKRKFIDPWKW